MSGNEVKLNFFDSKGYHGFNFKLKSFSVDTKKNISKSHQPNICLVQVMRLFKTSEICHTVEKCPKDSEGQYA